MLNKYLFWNKNIKKIELKSEAVVPMVLCKRDVPKSKNSQENICAGDKRVWYRCFPVNFEEHLCCRIFMNVYLCEMKQWKNIFTNLPYFHINVFTEKHRWWCPLKYSCSYEGLEFYLKGSQSQMLSCRICEVLQGFNFTEH